VKKIHKGDVIVRESVSRAQVVAAEATRQGLHYILFRVLLLEGEMSIQGDAGLPYEASFAMDPAFISIGDRRHIYGCGCVDKIWVGGRWWDQDKVKRERNVYRVHHDMEPELRSKYSHRKRKSVLAQNFLFF
jgi:hypothetical protein